VSQFDTANTNSTGGPLSSNEINPAGRPPAVVARNHATVTVSDTVTGNALITRGVANSIGASAIGATAGASIAQSDLGNAGGMDLTTLPTNAITVGNIRARNTGAVGSTTAISGSATIANGVENAIVNQATGASAGASIASLFDRANTTSGGSTTISTNSVTAGNVTAVNRGAVTATESSGKSAGTSALISFAGSGLADTANTIGVSAVGASAGSSINQVSADPAAVDLTLLPSNTISTGNISATNRAAGTVTATLTTGDATIGSGTLGGVANSITAVGIGAAATASITSRFDTITAGFGSTVPSTNSINPTGTPPTLTATNHAAVTVADTISGDALINAGVGNTIGASGVGATAGASIVQSADNEASGISATTLPINSIRTGAISATNDGVVDVSSTPFSVSGTATISAGMANSIAAQGVGAAAGASISSVFDNLQIAPTGAFAPVPSRSSNTVTTGSLTATNNNTVTVTATIGGDSLISAGVGNSIGASAVGASAGSSITQSASNSPAFAGLYDNLNLLPTNTITTGNILATNNSAVTTTFTESGNATIGAGIGNSIMGQGVGAAASADISSRFDTVATNPASLPGTSSNSINPTGTPPTITADNAATVTVTASIGTDALISAGVANNIGGSGIGGAASASISQSVSNNQSVAGGFDLTTLPTNSVTVGLVLGGTSGSVGVTTTITGNATITNGVSNSISGQAVGSLADASITSRVDNVQTVTPTTVTPSSNTITAGDIVSFGFAPTVTSTVNIGTKGSAFAVITDGVANFVGSSAIGASAGAGISQSVSNSVGAGGNDLTTLPTNTVTVASLTSDNTATVTSSLTVTGNSTTIGAGVNNSIASQAVGAGSAASISSLFDNVVTTTPSPITPSTNQVTVTGPVTAVNSGSVTSTTDLGKSAANLVSITGGVANSIGSSAVGASAEASITQVAYSSTGMTLGTLPSNTLTTGALTATNTGPITATLSIGSGSASITGGMNNSITAQSIGASAGGSISQHIANVNTK
jgi:hypothetical protein